MQTSSSANLTWSEFSSASEYTATVLIPSSRQAQITRRAISPRLAMGIFLNMECWPGSVRCLFQRDSEPARLYRKQPLPILYRLPILDVRADDLTIVLRRDLVHQLHRLDDAQNLILLDPLTDFNERRSAGLGTSIEGSHNRRLDDRKFHGLLILGGRRQNRGGGNGRYRHLRRLQRGDRRVGNGRGHWKRHGCLPNPELHSVALDLEFRQVVLPDQLQDP